MATYYRKRSKFPKPANPEMIHLNRQEETPALARQVLPISDRTLKSNDGTPHDTTIEAGSFYELDHADLPPRTPVQLWSIRVVMVSENTEVNVSVRFPSVQSLKSYFSNRIKEIFPALDEKFVMGTVLAGKVLRRQIPFEEFTEKKYLEGFWMASTEPIGGLGEVITKKGTCLFELTSNGIVRWGVRRQVKYLGRHKENINPQSSFVTGEGKAIIEEGVKKDEDVEEEEAEGEHKEDEEYEADEVDKKRKRYSFRKVTKAAKKPKVEKQIQVYKPKKNCRQLVLKSPTDRWSEQRYKLAEKNLLEVMQAQGAVFGNPILRPALRTEARKRIGDTGLLDHLLKHMAGKVAPGGKERFRRRHNAEGAMEYWLESADLVNIRKEAGVQDPYWTPPPGWKSGDCISKDSISANELRLLKEEISNMKRKMKDQMVPLKLFQDEMAKLKSEMMEIVLKKEKESRAVVVSNPDANMCQQMNLETSLVASKSGLDTTLIPQLEWYKEELMAITDSVRSMKEEMGKLTSKVEEKTDLGSEVMVTNTGSVACPGKVEKQAEKVGKELAVEQEQVVVGDEGSGGEGRDVLNLQVSEKAAAAAAEEKAARKERLKSGFTICKPQGTFLWPNMVRNNKNNNSSSSSSNLSPQVLVQVEDLFVVPTPPSVSSSTASAPPQLPYHHPNPPSPVKPVAEKRAVTVTVSTVSKGTRRYEDGDDYSTTTTTTTTTTNKNNHNKTTTTLINLNDFPGNPAGDEGFCGNPSSQQTVTTSTVMPTVLPSKMKLERARSAPWEAQEVMSYIPKRQQQIRGCSSSLTSCLSTTGAAGTTWLALATPSSGSEGDSSRG